MKLTSRNGKLWITFYHQSQRYRRSLELEDTKTNRKLATNKVIPEIVYKLNQGMFFEETERIPTVSEYAKISFEMNKGNRKASTIQDYEISYRLHIKPYFGNKRLDKVKASDIQIWQTKLLETRAPRRVRNIRAVLNGFFADALRDEIIIKNPISLVKVPKVIKTEVHPFSMEEILLIIKNAKDDLKAFYALGFFTGMRSGELVGLKWCDVDFRRKELSIIRAIRMGIESSPKTSNSIRTIEIIDTLLPYLKAQYEVTGKKDSYVFLNDQDTHYYDIKRIRDTHWKKLLLKLEIPYRPIYHMRHTFATIMIENGEDILWVSHMMGHSDPKMTLDKYARYVKREEKKRATFLENYLV